MKTLDMSGVDPLRWAEVRNRIAVVTSFLSLEGPTEADRMEHAGRLGIRRTQFLKLVRAWKAHGTAVAIAGSRPVREKARIGWRALPETSERVMRETLEGLGPDVRPSVATAAVVDVLASRGLQAPDPSTVWRRLMTMRQERGAVGDAGDVVVAECRIRLPVLSGDVVAMPSLLIAARTSDGIVVAALPLEGDGPDFAGFALAVVAAGAGGRITVDRDFVDRLEDAGGILRPVRPGVARTLLTRVVGRTLGRIELQFNRTGAPAERLLRTREDRPLGPVDSRRALEDAIGVHNAGRGGSRAFFLFGTSGIDEAGDVGERRH